MSSRTKSLWELDNIIQELANEWHGSQGPDRINFVLGCWDQANGFGMMGIKTDAYREGIAAAKKKRL